MIYGLDPAISVSLIVTSGSLIGLIVQGVFAKRQRTKIGEQVTRIEVNTNGKVVNLEGQIHALTEVVDMLRHHIADGPGAPLSAVDEASTESQVGPISVDPGTLGG